MKVNELVRKLAKSKAGRLMIEEAERRDNEMAEDERHATEYAAIIAGRPALAEQFAERNAAVREKMDEIIARHRADHRLVEDLRAKKTSVHNALCACDRAEMAQRRLNCRRFPLIAAFREQLTLVGRHVSAEHLSRFGISARKALDAYRQNKIGTDDARYGSIRIKLELDQADSKNGQAIMDRLAAAGERIAEFELAVMPDMQAELERLAEQISAVLMGCCPTPRVLLPPSVEGLAMGRGVAA